jgi:hypothetical protein
MSFVVASCAVLASAVVSTEPVPVQRTEGLVHGFLSLSSLDGVRLAAGDLIQIARGSAVTTRLVFHFIDGSLHDETVQFRQARQFQFVKDHLVQRGPSFPQAIDMTIDGGTGTATVRYTDSHGAAKTESSHFDLPPDLSNGVLMTMLKNVKPTAMPSSVSFIAATPKPQLVKLALSSLGEEPFTTAGVARKAVHYQLKVDIGGLKGLLVPLTGKQPPDLHFWILEGEAPAFVKSEQQLYFGGPIWRIELASPVWPKSQRTFN